MLQIAIGVSLVILATILHGSKSFDEFTLSTAPDSVIVQGFQNQQAVPQAAQQAAQQAALVKNVLDAKPFNPSKSYSLGSFVIYKNNLWTGSGGPIASPDAPSSNWKIQPLNDLYKYQGVKEALDAMLNPNKYMTDQEKNNMNLGNQFYDALNKGNQFFDSFKKSIEMINKYNPKPSMVGQAPAPLIDNATMRNSIAPTPSMVAQAPAPLIASPVIQGFQSYKNPYNSSPAVQQSLEFRLGQNSYSKQVQNGLLM